VTAKISSPTQPNPKGHDVNTAFTVGTRVTAPAKGYRGTVTQVLGNPEYVVVAFDRWNGQHIGSQTVQTKGLTIEPNVYDIDVCTDCYLDHHGVNESEEPSDCKTWSLVPEAADVSDNTCPDHDGDDETACTTCGQTGYGTGITEFTWASCDACGSHLGGSRYRMAVHS